MNRTHECFMYFVLQTLVTRVVGPRAKAQSRWSEGKSSYSQGKYKSAELLQNIKSKRCRNVSVLSVMAVMNKIFGPNYIILRQSEVNPIEYPSMLENDIFL